MSKWFLGLILFLSVLGCQRKESGESARLQLTLPASLGMTKAQVVARSGSGASWNSGLNPSQLSDINCYAVLVSGPEPEMQKGSCEMKDLSKMPVGLAFGLFTASSNQQIIPIDVPSGDQRVISIVGFVAAVGGCSSGMDNMKQDLLSVPHLIGQSTADLVPGESEKNNLSLTVALSVTSAKQIADCDGIIQPDPSVSTTTTTTTTSTTTTTLSANVAPVATNDVMTVELSNGGIAVNPLGNDTDADGDTLAITGATNGAFGTVSFNAATVTYTPNGVYIGLDSFTYTIDDGNGETATATIQVRVMSPFTWTGAVNSTWSTSGNWCGSVAAPGLSGTCSGGQPPSTADTAVFNSFCSTCNANLTAAATIHSMILDTTYTGTFTQGNYSLSLVTGALKVLGGSFVGGTGNLSVAGDLYILTTGNFTAPSGTLTLSNSTNVTINPVGTFSHNNGTISIGRSGSVSLTVGAGITLDNLSFTSSGGQVVTLNSGNIVVGGDLSLSSGSRATINSGNFFVHGNIISSGQGAKGTAFVKVAGTGAQTISGGTATSWIPNLVINKTSGILTYLNYVPVFGHYRWELGDTNTGSLTELILVSESAGSYDFKPGSLNNYPDVTFEGYGATYNMGGQTLEMTGSLMLADATTRGFLDNGTVRLRGDLDLLNHGKTGTANIVIYGSTNQFITGQSTAGCPDLEINSSGGTVSLFGDILLLGGFTYTSGSVNPGTSTVEFGGTSSVTVASSGMGFHNMKFSGTAKNIDLVSQTMTVNGSLVLADTATGTLNNGFIYVYGNVTSTVNGKGGSANIKMSGSAAATLNQVSASAKFPGTLYIYKGGGVATLTANLVLSTVGQDLTIAQGTLNQAGFNTTVNDVLTIDAGATLTLNSGTKSHGSFINNGTLL